MHNATERMQTNAEKAVQCQNKLSELQETLRKVMGVIDKICGVAITNTTCKADDLAKHAQNMCGMLQGFVEEKDSKNAALKRKLDEVQEECEATIQETKKLHLCIVFYLRSQWRETVKRAVQNWKVHQKEATIAALEDECEMRAQLRNAEEQLKYQQQTHALANAVQVQRNVRGAQQRDAVKMWELNAAQARCNAAESERNKLQEQLHTTKVELGELQAGVDLYNYEHENRGATDEEPDATDELEAKFAKAQVELFKLVEESNHTSQLNQDHECTIYALREGNKVLRAKLTETKAKLAETQAKLDATVQPQQTDKFDKNMGPAEDTVPCAEELETQNATTKTVPGNVEAVLENILEYTVKGNEDLGDIQVIAQKKMQQWAAKAEAVCSSLEAENSSLEAEKSDLEAEKSDLEAEKSDLEARCITLEAEKSDLEARCITLQAENRKSEATIKDLKDDLKDQIERQLKAASKFGETNLDHVKEQLKQREYENNSLKREIENLVYVEQNMARTITTLDRRLNAISFDPLGQDSTNASQPLATTTPTDNGHVHKKKQILHLCTLAKRAHDRVENAMWRFGLIVIPVALVYFIILTILEWEIMLYCQLALYWIHDAVTYFDTTFTAWLRLADDWQKDGCGGLCQQQS